MEKLDIIEFDEKEYMVYEKLECDHEFYYILCPIENEQVKEEAIVVKEKDGLIYSIDNEEEQNKIKKLIENLD